MISFRLLLAYSALLLGLTIIPALLLKRGGNRVANRLLALSLTLQLPLPLLVALGYHNLMLGEIAGMVLWVAPTFSLVLLIGYIKAMIDPGYRLRATDLLYALPFLALMLAARAIANFSTETMRQAQGGWPPSPTAIIGIVYYLLNSLYLLYADHLLRQHRRRIEHLFSSKAGVDLRGIHWCIRLFLAVMMLGLLFSLLRLVPGVTLWPRLIYSIATIVAFYYLIAFLAVTQPAIFAGNPPLPAEPEPAPEPDSAGEPARAKYETSALTSDSAEQQWQRLQRLLQEQKPWLKNDLRLSELAELAQLPAYQLSQIINQCAGKNFFELMNGYRLEQAKQLLAEHPAMKIAAIALESGYNSQSVFYKHFKQATGLTPSEFRRLDT